MKTDQHNKQAKSTSSNNIDMHDIERDIKLVLENAACPDGDCMQN